MNLPKRFIIIDDDKGNNLLFKVVVRKAFDHEDVLTFNFPAEAVEYIRETYSKTPEPIPTVLFLDINMPIMSGWEVLDVFSTFPESVRTQFKIFLLSSSIELEDKQRAEKISDVTMYLEKPMTVEKIIELFSNSYLDYTII